MWKPLLKQLCSLALSSVDSLSLLIIVVGEVINNSKHFDEVSRWRLYMHGCVGHLCKLHIYLVLAHKKTEIPGCLSQTSNILKAYMSRIDQDEIREASEIPDSTSADE